MGQNRWIACDRLLIAPGADARLWRVPGADLASIFFIRTQKDIQRKALDPVAWEV